MKKITAQEAQAMVSHWLHTPTNGYLGSDYGQDAKAMLQNPQSLGLGDAFLNKLRQDVPILQTLGTDDLNLYAVTEQPDKLKILIEMAGRPIEVAEVDK